MDKLFKLFSYSCVQCVSFKISQIKNIATLLCAFRLAKSGATHPSGSMYWSSTGGVEAGSLLRAIMCWKVMSVCVLMSIKCASPSGPAGLSLGVLRNTCTMIGSLAARKASTACSWVALDRSLPFTLTQREWKSLSEINCCFDVYWGIESKGCSCKTDTFNKP